MTSIGSILQSAEAPQSAPAIRNQLQNFEAQSAELLELRTEAGSVYVLPSPWQRIRLRWTFRHFHVLPAQVMSRSDQRLIEKLSQSAVIHPVRPVAGSSVFGVVEKIRSKPAAPVAHPAMPSAERVAAQPAPPELERLEPKEIEQGAAGLRAWNFRQIRLGQWGALGSMAAVCIPVILVAMFASISRTAQFSSTRSTEHATPATQAPIAVNHPRPLPLRPTAILPAVHQPRHAVSLHPALSSVAAHGTGADTKPEPSAAVDVPLVTELPQGHVVYPMVAGQDMVGELQLKALVGADGSVEKITVLSGSPKLAEAGIRAVRQWHYAPYQALGSPVPVQTRIKMSFFGPDAISIASVANTPSPQLK